MVAASLVDQAWSCVVALLRQLEDRPQVLVTALEPNECSLNPRFYVLIDDPAVVAHLGLWNDCTLRCEAVDVRSRAILLQYELLLQAPDEIIPYFQALLELLHAERTA